MLALSATILLLLNRRAWDRAIGTVDAAIALFGLKHRTTVRALVEELARIGGHLLLFGMAAVRTGEDTFSADDDHGGMI